MTIIQGKSLTPSVPFNIVIFCVREHSQQGTPTRVIRNSMHFVKYSGSLHNKRSRLRHFECSIHHGTNRTYEVGWWKNTKGIRRKCIKCLTELFFFMFTSTRLGLENGSVFQELMQQFYLESQGSCSSLSFRCCLSAVWWGKQSHLDWIGTSPPTHVKGTKKYCLL